MADSGFIFLLVLGAALLIAILTVAHVSAHRLSKRLEEKHKVAAESEPEFEFDSPSRGYKVTTLLDLENLGLRAPRVGQEIHRA